MSRPPSSDELIHLSLRELRERFLERAGPIPADRLAALERDPRVGARAIAARLRRRSSENRREGQRLRHLQRFERELERRGYRHIAGVDEAGMAPLAGPVFAAAVILPLDFKLRGIDDSKKILQPERRDEMAEQIRADAISWAVGRAEVEEIDSLNIYHAGLLAMARALQALEIQPDFILVDARRIPHCTIPQRGIVRGDALSVSIAAASLLAKTGRDAYMIEMDRLYSGYNFASHKGYPTPEHCRLLEELGPLPIHRRSFARVRLALRADPVQRQLFD